MHAGLGEEARGIRAACAVASAHGLACGEASILAYKGGNIVVHLAPSPVVARTATLRAALHVDIERWLRREVAIGRFLADAGAPSTAPSDLLPPGPHERDGVWMTMWQRLEHDPRVVPPASAAGASLRRLHEVLAGYDGDLPPYTALLSEIGRLLDETSDDPELDRRDRMLLYAELDRLAPVLFEVGLPTQPLHGNASLRHLLSDRGRLAWSNFEDACRGPLAWDLGALALTLRQRGATQADVDEALRAHGLGIEAPELEPFIAAHALYETAWLAFLAQRRPSWRGPANDQLGWWRATHER